MIQSFVKKVGEAAAVFYGLLSFISTMVNHFLSDSLFFRNYSCSDLYLEVDAKILQL